MKNKIVAGVLGILLGGFGIHKFYMGNILAGVLYFIFSWTCIPGVLGLIEGIICLVEDEGKFQSRVAAKKFFF
ncbi:MAG: TM2 domain-containing protein [Bacteroidaceae bacterium]|nr:TM2 domain-containing protein [Bacteroidaceae bacterium]